MTDPIPAPDDDSAATRARIAALAEMRAIQLRLMEEERDAALLVFGLTSRERDRLKLELEASNNEYQKFGAELAKWKDLLNIAPEGAEGPADIARWIKELRAVAEAAKALAAAEQWHYYSSGSMSWSLPAIEQQVRLKQAIAEAILALGPLWDWRAK